MNDAFANGERHCVTGRQKVNLSPSLRRMLVIGRYARLTIFACSLQAVDKPKPLGHNETFNKVYRLGLGIVISLGRFSQAGLAGIDSVVRLCRGDRNGKHYSG